MKFLISGASGFIGSRLAEELIKKDHNVTGLFFKNSPSNPKMNSIKYDLEDSQNKLPNEHYDAVFHLAAETPLQKNKDKIKKVNYEGTINFFNQIKKKTDFLIYITGLGIFGDSGQEVISEHTPYRPHTYYSKVRLDAQKFLEEKCKENSIAFSVAILGEVYGNGGWFSSQIIHRLKNKSLRVPKGGEYTRCLIHVDDVVRALVAIGEKKIKNESFILTDSKPIMFKEFLNYTAKLLGVKPPGGVPIFLAKTVMGGDAIKLLTTSVKTSNKKILELIELKYPSYENGVKEVISPLS